MRLDHLLSKEHLKLVVFFHSVGCTVSRSYARFEGVCSSAGAHGWNINEQVLPGFFRIGEYAPPGGWKAGSGSWSGGYRLAHCWVLRQQDLLFLVFPAHAGGRLVVPLAGCLVWWMGVTGLLFENYIVDASILKLLSAISDKPGRSRCP